MTQHDPVSGKKKGCGHMTSASEGVDSSTTAKSPTKASNAALSLRINNNKIQSLDDIDDALDAVFDHPSKLQWLDLSGNALTMIPPAAFSKYKGILTLHLHGNALTKYSDIDALAAHLPTLHALTLHGNPVEEKKHYKSYVIASFPSLKQLDFSSITKADRDKAETWAKIYKQALEQASLRRGKGRKREDCLDE